jgi:hypothetical protein
MIGIKEFAAFLIAVSLTIAGVSWALAKGLSGLIVIPLGVVLFIISIVTMLFVVALLFDFSHIVQRKNKILGNWIENLSYLLITVALFCICLYTFNNLKHIKHKFETTKKELQPIPHKSKRD